MPDTDPLAALALRVAEGQRKRKRRQQLVEQESPGPKRYAQIGEEVFTPEEFHARGPRYREQLERITGRTLAPGRADEKYPAGFLPRAAAGGVVPEGQIRQIETGALRPISKPTPVSPKPKPAEPQLGPRGKRDLLKAGLAQRQRLDIAGEYKAGEEAKGQKRAALSVAQLRAEIETSYGYLPDEFKRGVRTTLDRLLATNPPDMAKRVKDIRDEVQKQALGGVTAQQRFKRLTDKDIASLDFRQQQEQRRINNKILGDKKSDDRTKLTAMTNLLKLDVSWTQKNLKRVQEQAEHAQYMVTLDTGAGKIGNIAELRKRFEPDKTGKTAVQRAEAEARTARDKLKGHYRKVAGLKAPTQQVPKGKLKPKAKAKAKPKPMEEGLEEAIKAVGDDPDALAKWLTEHGYEVRRRGL